MQPAKKNFVFAASLNYTIDGADAILAKFDAAQLRFNKIFYLTGKLSDKGSFKFSDILIASVIISSG